MALERGFTTLQPIKLVLCARLCGSISLLVGGSKTHRFSPVAALTPLLPTTIFILTVRTPRSYILQTTAGRTTKQLYTYFMESDIVFRIAIVHGTDLGTAIDTEPHERYDRAGKILSANGDMNGRYMKASRVFKRLQTVNGL